MSGNGSRRTTWRRILAERGWALVEDVAEPGDVERLLGGLGRLQPQYGGNLRHSVKARPGFDHLQYSQSRNGITPHTEAPGLAPPPHYLALHCHRQARCGSGHTVLTDGYAFFDSLEPSLRAEAEARPIRFDLVPNAGVGDRGPVAAPLWSSNGSAAPILRYSYNVMRDGSLEGPVRERDDLDGLDPFLASMCRLGARYVEREGAAVLSPDHSLLVFDNWRVIHSRPPYRDARRALTRYWVG